jgi:hypothetical protein
LTLKVLAVFSKASVSPEISEFLPWIITQFTSFLAENIGLAKSWKDASLPFSTNELLPSSRAGLGIILAWNLFIF